MKSKEISMRGMLAVAVLFTAVLVSSSVNAGIIDTFEYADQSAFTSVWNYASWSNPQGIRISSTTNHTSGGSMAVELYETANSANRGVERALDDEAVAGSASFWIYDPADSAVNNNGLWVGVINTHSGYRSWNLGVNSGSSYLSNYWFDIAGTKTESTVARTQGWHEFRFEVGTDAAGGETNARLFIDDVAVKTQWYGTGNVAFDTARIMAAAPGTRAGSEFYVDDFSASIPEPAAMSLFIFSSAAVLMFRRVRL